LVLLAAILVLSAVVDFLVVGTGITQGVWRWLRNKLTSTLEIDTPPDLAIAAANRLVAAGSEVVVGFEAEWNESHVVAYAIPPHLVSAPIGTRFEVIHVDAKKVRLRPVLEAPATGSDQGEQGAAPDAPPAPSSAGQECSGGD